MKYNFIILIFSILFCCSTTLAQQLTLHGTVYNYFDKKPVNAVTVYTSSGNITITDSLGKYALQVKNSDSIWFSYLNKNSIILNRINNITK